MHVSAECPLLWVQLRQLRKAGPKTRGRNRDHQEVWGKRAASVGRRRTARPQGLVFTSSASDQRLGTYRRLCPHGQRSVWLRGGQPWMTQKVGGRQDTEGLTLVL